MFFKNYKLKGFATEDYSFEKLKDYEVEIPIGKNHPGSFGFKRKHHTHEGIDLYCKENDEVLSLTDGKIIDINNFTGELCGSPWWNNTSYVSIEYKKFIIVYGEIIVNSNLRIGDIINKNDIIGKITPVLKEIKNNRPINMLHLELYEKEYYTEPKEWIEEKPKRLLSPLLLFDDIVKGCF